MTSLISLVVPVLDDFDAAARLLAGVSADPRVEIVLVDGGSDLRLDRLAAGRGDTRVIRGVRGRGAQMNAGASASTSPWLAFVHADSTLPARWLEQLASMPPDVVGGWFAFGLDDAAWQARVIEHGVRWRVRLFHLPYGDQGLFVRRDAFERLGGYRDVPLMEDVDFVRRLCRFGRCIEIPLPLITSSRRWRRDGWIRRSARNLALLTLYFGGVSPDTLAKWYGAGATRSVHSRD
jgi:rSAM/selenodomain-associated transferase 2